MSEIEHYMSIPVSEFEALHERIKQAEQERDEARRALVFSAAELDEAKRELKGLQAYVHKQTEAWGRHD